MEKKVEFNVGKDTLRGLVFIPKGKGPFPGVICFHGSGSDGETQYEIAKYLSKKGILGFAFNFRGCGKSDGRFENQTIEMGQEDAKAGLGFFLSLAEVNKNRTGLYGSSFGGFWAAMLADKYKFKSLVLSAPAAYAPKILNKRHVDFVNEFNELRKDYEKSQSYKEIEKFSGNLLVAKCELDDVLAPVMVERYLEKSKLVKRKEEFIVKGAKHRISQYPQAKKILQKKIVEWFKETL
ncbi:MAG: alpha/beta fold hydrolase [Candidatus Levyibacteriota bacterium]